MYVTARFDGGIVIPQLSLGESRGRHARKHTPPHKLGSAEIYPYRTFRQWPRRQRGLYLGCFSVEEQGMGQGTREGKLNYWNLRETEG